MTTIVTSFANNQVCAQWNSSGGNHSVEVYDTNLLGLVVCLVVRHVMKLPTTTNSYGTRQDMIHQQQMVAAAMTARLALTH